MFRNGLRCVIVCAVLAATYGCHTVGDYAYQGYDHNATLVVYRLAALTLAAAPAFVAVDGAVIAELGQKDYVVVQLAPGRHELRLQADGFPRSDTVAFEARDLDWYYYEVEPNSAVAVAATASDFDPTIVGATLGLLFMQPFLLRPTSEPEFSDQVDGLERVATGGSSVTP